jgi:Kdo2-lipid IVA lauroyltransferase/acyltransferase
MRPGKSSLMKKLKRTLISIISVPLLLVVVLLAMLPFRVLYVFSSGCAFLLYHVAGYRKKVVMSNLQKAFPEKKPEELQHIAWGFYRHLSDVMVEALKVMFASKAAMRRRICFTPAALKVIHRHYVQQKSIIVVMGHYGNWEWIGPGFNLAHPRHLHSAYKPLRNKIFDRLILRVRSRFAHQLVPSDQVTRHLIRLDQINQTMAFAMIADQSASPKTAYWLPFFNHTTTFFTGPEKLARKLNHPVVFCAIRKVKRGHYQMHAEIITETPRQMPPEAITAKYAQLLEAEIRRQPQHYLWSHRRWKHVKVEAEG